MARLLEFLALPAAPVIAIVGAGGKTTTMYTLAHELVEQGACVVTTTTTHIALPRPAETCRLLVDSDLPRLLKQLRAGWRDCRHITVAHALVADHKLQGIPPEQPILLRQSGGADVVIVEADGARHLKIKAPGAYEPVLPTQVSVVLLLLSAQALNQPLSSEIAHRPEILANLTGIASGDLLTPTVVARLLLHPQGGLKQIPEHAAVYVLVTHATPERLAAVAQLGQLLQATARITALYAAEQPGVWQRTEASADRPAPG
ncbi:MAG TPA: selenium cofactor biosynthesis protein YqeC [Ktedonobacteraceae bacterium]|jgi:probable selenium-dependent hydroxylase accessory protein YqeC